MNPEMAAYSIAILILFIWQMQQGIIDFEIGSQPQNHVHNVSTL